MSAWTTAPCLCSSHVEPHRHAEPGDSGVTIREADSRDGWEATTTEPEPHSPYCPARFGAGDCSRSGCRAAGAR